MLPKLVESGDGSHTIISPVFNVPYHSKHGAIQESMTVFIDAGLQYKSKSVNSIKIFEMGFGTGLNALLTYIFAIKNQVPIVYHTVEAFPLDDVVIQTINYGTILNEKETLKAIHNTEWNKEVAISNFFKLYKHHNVLHNITIDETFDIIYYDAFGPRSQPHLWDINTCIQLFNMLTKGGILVTYCAQGQFKRNLKTAGFEVQLLPGPIGKREMTRAIKV